MRCLHFNEYTNCLFLDINSNWWVGSIAVIGVVFTAPVMTRRALIWFLSKESGFRYVVEINTPLLYLKIGLIEVLFRVACELSPFGKG
ncbi:hypothetical protein TNCV_3903141 [Trichonephila clavipes]|nr:hypothetical protein TNCV_3903141 [Trichonephila clavipes]